MCLYLLFEYEMFPAWIEPLKSHFHSKFHPKFGEVEEKSQHFFNGNLNLHYFKKSTTRKNIQYLAQWSKNTSNDFLIEIEIPIWTKMNLKEIRCFKLKLQLLLFDFESSTKMKLHFISLLNLLGIKLLISLWNYFRW